MATHVYRRLLVKRVFTIFKCRTHIPTPRRWDDYSGWRWEERVWGWLTIRTGLVGTSYRYAGRAPR